MTDRTYSEDFQYTHDNPYHDRLEKYSEFVLRDKEAEEHTGKWNAEVFKREAPLYAEIGSGYGHFMTHFCEKNPDINFVGLDYRFKRSFQLAKKLDAHPSNNFRYLRAKGERIHYIFAENELDRIFYFFPDPWPKTRHKKKRLFQDKFLDSAYRTLKAGGEIYIKTDHDDYADWMEEVMNKSDLFEVTFATRDLRKEYPEHFLASFQTKFEKIFIEKGINIKAYVLKTKKMPNSEV